MLERLLQWLPTTALGLFVRESTWAFQGIVAIHIVGLSLSVGMMLWFDLRLLGLVLRTSPVSSVYRRLIPWAAAGFAVMLITGGMLFTGFAPAAYGNTAFRIKIAALAAAAVNALVYHRLTARRIASWDTMASPPWSARAAGLISLVVWAIVIVAGRIISYTMY